MRPLLVVLSAVVAAAAIVGSARAAQADAAGYVPPRFIHQVKPEYPDSARSASETGDVMIKVLVGTDGTPKSFTVFKSSGHKDLDNAVLAAVKQSTYRAAYSNGSPIVAFFDITYKFTLQGLASEEGSPSELEQKLAANPNDAQTRKTYAIVLMNKQEYVKAIDVLQKGTQLDPKNATFWSLLGYAYYSNAIQSKQNDQFKPSAEAYDKSLELAKPDSQTVKGAALSYGRYAFEQLQAQNFTGALPYARKAAGLDPKEVQYQIELGEALQGTGDNKGSLDAFKAAQSLDDHKSANITARILADMGVSLLATGQEAAGIASINEAERTAPASPVAYQALASYYIRNGKLDAALGPLGQLAQVSPTDPQVQVDLGDIYVQKHDYAKAKAAYDKALALDPKNANALFGAAQIAAAQGDIAGVATPLQQAIAGAPKNAAFYNASIAVLLLGLPSGKGPDPIPDAVKYSTAATQADANFANGWYDLGIAYARQNKKDQANAALHHAYDLFKAQNNQAGMDAVNKSYKDLNNSAISSDRNERANQAGQ